MKRAWKKPPGHGGPTDRELDAVNESMLLEGLGRLAEYFG
jgi:hypothetical protein